VGNTGITFFGGGLEQPPLIGAFVGQGLALARWVLDNPQTGPLAKRILGFWQWFGHCRHCLRPIAVRRQQSIACDLRPSGAKWQRFECTAERRASDPGPDYFAVMASRDLVSLRM